MVAGRCVSLMHNISNQLLKENMAQAALDKLNEADALALIAGEFSIEELNRAKAGCAPP